MSSEKPSLALSGTSDPSNADSNGVDSQTSSTGSLSVPYAASVEESRTALLDRHTQAEDLDGKSSRSFPTYVHYELESTSLPGLHVSFDIFFYPKAISKEKFDRSILFIFLPRFFYFQCHTLSFAYM